MGSGPRAFITLGALAAAGILPACSPPAGGDDGGTGGGDAGCSPSPVALPWLGGGSPAMLEPCPDGWRAVAEGGVTTCDPYPESGAASCPPGEAHFPGEPGCSPVGRPCPVGPFADGLPDDGSVLFVLAEAIDGDGSRARPFGRIADALAVARSGMTVAIGRGDYEEALTLRPGVRVAGACAAATRITIGRGTPPEALVTVGVSGAVLADVTLLLTDVVVRRTTPSETGLGGTALGAFVDASIEAERVELSDSSLAGIQLARGGTADLRSSIVSRNPIGVNAQDEGFDLDRLTHCVIYMDNVRDLDAQALPLPEPGP